MRFRLLAISLGLSTSCMAAQDAHSARITASQHDSATVIRWAWLHATEEHGRRVVWLWAPSSSDTLPVVHLSSAVINLLLAQQVPVSARLPLGHDTVVYRIASWRRDSLGQVVELHSAWTQLHGSSERRWCSRSGNVEQIRVRKVDAIWQAERVGPVSHGDGFCKVPAPIRGVQPPA